MSVTAVTERPAQRTPNGGGVAARRAVIRWAMRLLRREWRQQLLILALITVAVGATVVASAVAADTPAPVAGVLGTAQDAATLSGTPARINAEIKDLESRYGRVDVIENESVPVPGTQNTFDLRAQDPHGPFGRPLLSLVSGQYPANPDQLSGGERQRVAIARAMVGERRLLLADEPSGALDSVNAQAVMRLLLDACKEGGMAAVVVTHDAQLASWADRVVFLRDGRVTDQTAAAPGPESLLTPEQNR